MTYLVYDIVLVALLAIFVAFIGATVVSNALAGPLSRSIQPAVETSIRQLLEEAIQHTEFSDGMGGVASAVEDIPITGVVSVLRESEMFQGFAEAIQEQVDSGMIAAASNAVRTAAGFIAEQAARIVVFFLAFVLIMIAWFFVSHALDLVAKLPVLSAVNQWTGAALGLLQGVVLAFIVCHLLRGGMLSQEAVESTVALRCFCTVNPLTYF